jgi:energy-coupling factor transporter ATP-binding protein EcfA2
MSRPYVKRIESNVKRGCALDLGEKTLIVGPRGSGKSSVVNAVELALTGRASDVAGRATLAAPADLWMLAPPDAVKLIAKATLSDALDLPAVWSLGKGSRPVYEGGGLGENIMPLRAVRDAILGSAETARKWILAVAASGKCDLAIVPVPLRERLTSILSSADVRNLPIALDTAKERTRDATKRAKTIRETVKASSSGLPPPPTDAEIEASKTIGNLGGIKAAEARLAAAKTALDTAVAEAAKLPPAAPVQFVEAGRAIATILKAHVDNDGKKCGVCGSAMDVATARFRQQALVAKVQAMLDLAQKHEAVERARSEAQFEVGLAERDLATLKGAAAEAQPNAALVERKARWQQIKKMEAEAAALDHEAGEWSALADVLAKIVKDAVEGARRAFEARVQKFLPQSMRFGLELQDGDREVCRFGLRRVVPLDPPQIGETDLVEEVGVLHAALSGGEWAAVTAAIAAATMPAEGPAVVIPEDRAFDAEGLAETLAAFSAIDAQVIVTSTVEPTKVPAGWTVIRLGEKSAEKPLVVDTAAFFRSENPDTKAALDPHEGKPIADVNLAPVPGEKPKRKRRTKAEIEADKKAAAAATAPAVGRSVHEAPAEGTGAAGASAAAPVDLFDDGVPAQPAPVAAKPAAEAVTDPTFRASPDYCAECNARIAVGVCGHGVGPKTVSPPAAQDPGLGGLFDD